MKTSKLKNLIGCEVFFPVRCTRFGIISYDVKSDIIRNIKINVADNIVEVYYNNCSQVCNENEECAIFETRKDAEEYVNSKQQLIQFKNSQTFNARRAEIESELKKTTERLNKKLAEISLCYEQSKC